VTLFFTNLYDCAHVVVPAGEDGNQNSAGAAVTLPPMDAPYRGVEVTSCRAEEGAGCDHCRTAGAVGICGGRKAEVSAAVTSAAENRRSRICQRKRRRRDVRVEAASAAVTTAGRPEAVDVD
ncbi:hypothetical protein X777_03523, partial [Ooceraea biroi]